MLKITLHDTADELRFRLEGKLSGAWVTELHQCWQTAASTTAHRRTVLDMGEVDFVDPEGQALLTVMCRQGVCFKAVTPLIRTLIQEVEHSCRCATVEEQTARSSDVHVSSHSAARHSRAL